MIINIVACQREMSIKQGDLFLLAVVIYYCEKATMMAIEPKHGFRTAQIWVSHH